MHCLVAKARRTALRAALLLAAVPWMSFSSPVTENAAAGQGPAPDREDHWAFQPPRRPAVSPTPTNAWIRNPVDQFILAQLEKKGLRPSPEADPVTLLRRLHLDLIGLPPTPEEVDAFLADTSANAYEKQVDRLLQSPHYGERWGRHWLDAARYADSDGYEKDMSREMWPYRDYVIKAFNRDLPYDQFIIEQLAGDQLPRPTQDQRVATGFLRNSMINREGAIDPEQFRMDAMFDRMDALGKSILGLTIQCSQCHDHKYDPMTQEEYYRLFAFLNNDHETQPGVYTEEEQAKIRQLRAQMNRLEARLKKEFPGWNEQLTRWESEVRTTPVPDWVVLRDLHQEGDKSQRYQFLEDGSLLAEGYAPTKFTQWFTITNRMTEVRAFQLELLKDPNLPYGGPGRSFMGTCALTDFLVEATDLQNPGQTVQAKFTQATASFNQEIRGLESNFDDKSKDKRVTGPVTFATDGDPKTAWGIDAGPGRRNQPQQAVFVTDQPMGFPGGTAWRIGLQQNHGGWNSDDHMNNNLGRFRLSVSGDEQARAQLLPPGIRLALAKPPEKRSPAQSKAIFSYWRTTVPAFDRFNQQIESLWREWPEGTTSLTLTVRDTPRATHFLQRGDWLKPTKAVRPGMPAFLHDPEPDFTPTRLSLARWLASPESPTTARVFVNRVWQAYYGQGLVNTPEDFGRQSEPPSHPQLLDWLACEFMRPSPGTDARPWSIKHLHRLITTSTAYRQSSRVTPDLLTADPYNRWLARGPRFRVEGEIIRDIALTASGLLNRQIGGPSIMKPAPEFLFQPPASYAPFPWKHERGPNKYRRALYTFRRRSTPFPMLQTFDVPNADVSCVRRQRSNSPLQALVTLNEPLFVECAQALARLTLAQGGATDDQRLAYAFRRALARTPDPEEIGELKALLYRQLPRFAEGWINPNQIATGTAHPASDIPPGSNPSQLAAYTVVSRALLNLDETLTKE